ncbi:hypothetical protein AGMMS50256_36780 [Betaproteobacteria bacterium]|nr:hypothetical protein AGMMS50256_36780 [Betaproteobacteria bacterium]
MKNYLIAFLISLCFISNVFALTQDTKNLAVSTITDIDNTISKYGLNKDIYSANGANINKHYIFAHEKYYSEILASVNILLSKIDTKDEQVYQLFTEIKAHLEKILTLNIIRGFIIEDKRLSDNYINWLEKNYAQLFNPEQPYKNKHDLDRTFVEDIVKSFDVVCNIKYKISKLLIAQ